MYRHSNPRPNQPNQLHPHLGIHRHHQQRQLRARDRRAPEMGEHEVDGFVAGVGVAFWDLVELRDEEGVACYVDSKVVLLSVDCVGGLELEVGVGKGVGDGICTGSRRRNPRSCL